MAGFGFHELFKKNRLYHEIGNKFYPFGFSRPMIRFVSDNYKHDITGVEIGVQRGYHSLNMFTVLGDRLQKLYLIDPWAKDNELDKEHDWFNTLPVAKKVLNRYKDRVVYCKGFSQDEKIISNIPDDSVDFVYIDGNHDYETTKQDIFNFLPKVKLGGVLGGHDMTVGAPGVIQAVQEFIDETGYTLQGSAFDWWVII